ncbi:MBL fold metallo-hydrolase [Desulfovibrio aerotolerans]|uniref:MBL fold metallo-hydrolase n=1 Tax=Solidesulfovibrio aerotolerans TaxID=295255 RepID=A0A7C9N4K9_9BACT|nr:MBL fold metallo-hydrolase [Solidesulfovibrio aerotolerans]MYL82515.1 MBL fold metallo-hydrolase [Solidesulfovibrio aerotolerans]
MINPIDTLRELGQKIDSAFYYGKNEEGLQLLKTALKESVDVVGYSLYFQSEYENYINRNECKSIELLQKAYEALPHDIFIVCNRAIAFFDQGENENAMDLFNKVLAEDHSYSKAMVGVAVILSIQGHIDQAREFFLKAIALNNTDSHAMTQLGVSLGENGKDLESLKWFVKALSINDKEFNAMREIGVFFSRKGKEDKAVKWFEKSLHVNEGDAYTYRCYAVSCVNLGDMQKALGLIKKALVLDSRNKDFQQILEYISSNLGLKFEDILRDIDPTIVAGETSIEALRGLVRKTQERFAKEICEFGKKMVASEDRLKDFLGLSSNVQCDRSLLLTLRRWNSYTPTIPSINEERYVGGGYVIYHQGRAVVIDPGHNFIENFSQAGGMLCDIDAIVMTHAHSDHTNDFESLLTLVYEYNQANELKMGMEKYKKIDIYLNVGAMKKFSGLIDLRGSDYINQVCVMTPFVKYTLANGVVVCPLPAYHDELITKKYALGLHISVPVLNGKKKNILFTSDTGLFPQIKKKVGAKKEATVADVTKDEIFRLYGSLGKNVDLLIPHLGSIKPEEITSKIDTEWEEIFYPNHLGVLGVIRLIAEINPKIVFISEFGEELIGFRSDLMKMLQEVVSNFFEGRSECPVVLPADTPLIYDIIDDKIYCVVTQAFQSASGVRFKQVNDTFYYYKSESKCTDSQFGLKCQMFSLKLQSREDLYFKGKA